MTDSSIKKTIQKSIDTSDIFLYHQGKTFENIMSREIKILDFSVIYHLYEFSNNNIDSGEKKSYSLKLKKVIDKETKNNMEYNTNPREKNTSSTDKKYTVLEESIIFNFENRYSTAIKIFNKLIENEVTPMCLEDSILEII